MFSITLICMGKLKERFYTEAAAEYAKRLRAYCDFQLIELPECRLPEGLLFLRPDAGGEAAVL